MTVNDQTLSSLAILKVNFDQRGQDYIDNFVPFVVDALRQVNTTGTTAAQAQKSIHDTFGIAIPQGAVATVLRRAVRRDLALSRADGRFALTPRGVEYPDLASARDQARREQKGLIDRLISFSRGHAETEWDEAIATAALIRFALNRGARVLATRGALADESPAGSTPDEDHLLGEFVVGLARSDSAGLTALESLIKGALLASAMYYPDLGRLPSRFERLDVYLDTRFVLRALGTAGAEHQAACIELLDLVFELGGGLKVFDNTLIEIRGVLNAASIALRNPANLRRGSGETLEFLASAGQRSSDVELLIAQLPRRLAALRIAVADRPPYTPALGVDEARFEALLAQGRPPNRPYPEDAMRHDVAALTAIHRIRGGRPQPVLESARALFLTTNALLARAGAEFFREQYGVTGVPLCYADHQFATLAWLKKPTAAPELPRLYVIADSFAALSPPDGLWRAYLSEISRLQEAGEITEDDYFSLRFTTAAKAALVDLADAADEIPPTVPEILRRARLAMRAELEAELTASGVPTEAPNDGSVAAELEELRRVTQEATVRRRAQIRSISVTLGRWAARLTLVFGSLFVAVFAYATLGGFLPTIPAAQLEEYRAALYVAGFTFLLLTIANLVFGTSIRSISRSIEVFVTRRASASLSARFE